MRFFLSQLHRRHRANIRVHFGDTSSGIRCAWIFFKSRSLTIISWLMSAIKYLCMRHEQIKLNAEHRQVLKNSNGIAKRCLFSKSQFSPCVASKHACPSCANYKASHEAQWNLLLATIRSRKSRTQNEIQWQHPSLLVARYLHGLWPFWDDQYHHPYTSLQCIKVEHAVGIELNKIQAVDREEVAQFKSDKVRCVWLANRTSVTPAIVWNTGSDHHEAVFL